MPYQVRTPENTAYCATPEDVRRALDVYLASHPGDHGRVVIEEVGEGRTAVGAHVSPQEFFGPVEMQPTAERRSDEGRPSDVTPDDPAPPIETPLTPEPGNPPLDPNPERDDPGGLDPEHAP